jgi:hypothetical protein
MPHKNTLLLLLLFLLLFPQIRTKKAANRRQLVEHPLRPYRQSLVVGEKNVLNSPNNERKWRINVFDMQYPHYGTMKKTRRACHYYSVFFLLTSRSLFLQLVRIFQTIQPPKSIYALLVLAAMATPMQGLPNFVVYLYPTYCRARRQKKQPHRGCWRWFVTSLMGLRSSSATSSDDGVRGEKEQQTTIEKSAPPSANTTTRTSSLPPKGTDGIDFEVAQAGSSSKPLERHWRASDMTGGVD